MNGNKWQVHETHENEKKLNGDKAEDKPKLVDTKNEHTVKPNERCHMRIVGLRQLSQAAACDGNVYAVPQGTDGGKHNTFLPTSSMMMTKQLTNLTHTN